jgi:hypothetical protein
MVDGCHSGDDLGQYLFDIIQNIGIAHKVCVFRAFIPKKQVDPSIDWPDYT